MYCCRSIDLYGPLANRFIARLSVKRCALLRLELHLSRQSIPQTSPPKHHLITLTWNSSTPSAFSFARTPRGVLHNLFNFRKPTSKRRLKKILYWSAGISPTHWAAYSAQRTLLHHRQSLTRLPAQSYSHTAPRSKKGVYRELITTTTTSYTERRNPQPRDRAKIWNPAPTNTYRAPRPSTHGVTVETSNNTERPGLATNTSRLVRRTSHLRGPIPPIQWWINKLLAI